MAKDIRGLTTLGTGGSTFSRDSDQAPFILAEDVRGGGIANYTTAERDADIDSRVLDNNMIIYNTTLSQYQIYTGGTRNSSGQMSGGAWSELQLGGGGLSGVGVFDTDSDGLVPSPNGDSDTALYYIGGDGEWHHVNNTQYAIRRVYFPLHYERNLSTIAWNIGDLAVVSGTYSYYGGSSRSSGGEPAPGANQFYALFRDSEEAQSVRDDYLIVGRRVSDLSTSAVATITAVGPLLANPVPVSGEVAQPGYLVTINRNKQTGEFDVYNELVFHDDSDFVAGTFVYQGPSGDSDGTTDSQWLRVSNIAEHVGVEMLPDRVTISDGNGSSASIFAASTHHAGILPEFGDTHNTADSYFGGNGLWNFLPRTTDTDSEIVSAAITGDRNKTLTLTKKGGGTIVATFTDSDEGLVYTGGNGIFISGTTISGQVAAGGGISTNGGFHIVDGAIDSDRLDTDTVHVRHIKATNSAGTNQVLSHTGDEFTWVDQTAIDSDTLWINRRGVPKGVVNDSEFAIAGPGGTSQGTNTQSWGYQTIARGNHAQAYGINVLSDGTNVAGIGRNLESRGTRTGNIGADNVHIGNIGFTIGSGNVVGDSEKLANTVEVLGANNVVDSDLVTIVGSNNTSRGHNLRIYGNLNEYYGQSGSIIGIANTVGDSDNELAGVGVIGQGNNIQASGAYVGVNNSVRTAGTGAAVYGNANTIANRDALVYGNRNVVHADRAHIFGEGNRVDTDAPDSIIIGENNRSSQDDSVNIGFSNELSRSDTVAVGRDIHVDKQGVFLGYAVSQVHSNFNTGGDHNIFIGAGDTDHASGDKSGITHNQFGNSNIGIGSYVIFGDSEAQSAARVYESIAIGNNIEMAGQGQVAIGSRIYLDSDSDGEIRIGGTAQSVGSFGFGSHIQYPTVHPDMTVTRPNQLATKQYVDDNAGTGGGNADSDSDIVSAAFTGTNTKTLTLTKNSGGTITASFTDRAADSEGAYTLGFENGDQYWNNGYRRIELEGPTDTDDIYLIDVPATQEEQRLSWTGSRSNVVVSGGTNELLQIRAPQNFALGGNRIAQQIGGAVRTGQTDTFGGREGSGTYATDTENTFQRLIVQFTTFSGDHALSLAAVNFNGASVVATTSESGNTQTATVTRTEGFTYSDLIALGVAGQTTNSVSASFNFSGTEANPVITVGANSDGNIRGSSEHNFSLLPGLVFLGTSTSGTDGVYIGTNRTSTSNTISFDPDTANLVFDTDSVITNFDLNNDNRLDDSEALKVFAREITEALPTISWDSDVGNVQDSDSDYFIELDMGTSTNISSTFSLSAGEGVSNNTITLVATDGSDSDSSSNVSSSYIVRDHLSNNITSFARSVGTADSDDSAAVAAAINTAINSHTSGGGFTHTSTIDSTNRRINITYSPGGRVDSEIEVIVNHGAGNGNLAYSSANIQQGTNAIDGLLTPGSGVTITPGGIISSQEDSEARNNLNRRIQQLQEELNAGVGVFPIAAEHNSFVARRQFTDFAVASDDRSIVISTYPKDTDALIALAGFINNSIANATNAVASIRFGVVDFRTSPNRFVQTFVDISLLEVSGSPNAVYNEANNTLTIHSRIQGTNGLVRVLDANGNTIADPSGIDYGGGYFSHIDAYRGSDSAFVDLEDQFRNLGDATYSYDGDLVNRVPVLHNDSEIRLAEFRDGITYSTDDNAIELADSEVQESKLNINNNPSNARSLTWFGPSASGQMYWATPTLGVLRAQWAAASAETGQNTPLSIFGNGQFRLMNTALSTGAINTLGNGEALSGTEYIAFSTLDNAGDDIRLAAGHLKNGSIIHLENNDDDSNYVYLEIMNNSPFSSSSSNNGIRNVRQVQVLASNGNGPSSANELWNISIRPAPFMPVVHKDIASNAVDSENLALNSVITEKIADGAVTGAKRSLTPTEIIQYASNPSRFLATGTASSGETYVQYGIDGIGASSSLYTIFYAFSSGNPATGIVYSGQLTAPSGTAVATRTYTVSGGATTWVDS